MLNRLRVKVSIKTVSLLYLALVTSVVCYSQTEEQTQTFLRVSEDPSKNFSYPYYLYIPPELNTAEARAKEHTLLVITNNTGKISDNFEVHEADALRRMEQLPPLAEGLRVAVLMPVFPRPESDWKIYTQSLDRDSLLTSKPEYRRFYLQLLAMIDDARTRLGAEYGLNFERRVLMSGFSAQAMFANRFTFIHPDRVKAIAIGAPGGWPIAPVTADHETFLRYPIGVGDFREVTGQPINMRQLRQIPMLIYMGDQDDNDAVPYGDAYENQDREVIIPRFGRTPIERWNAARTLYTRAGLHAEFKLYPGVGHTITDQMRSDTQMFLQRYAD